MNHELLGKAARVQAQAAAAADRAAQARAFRMPLDSAAGDRAGAGPGGGPLGHGLHRALAVAEQARARARDVGARERRLKEQRDLAVQKTL